MQTEYHRPNHNTMNLCGYGVIRESRCHTTPVIVWALPHIPQPFPIGNCHDTLLFCQSFSGYAGHVSPCHRSPEGREQPENRQSQGPRDKKCLKHLKQPLQGTINFVIPNLLKRSTFFWKYSFANPTSPDS